MRIFLTLAGLLAAYTAVSAQQAEVKTRFPVKYVAEGAIYLEGGRTAGLAEGQKLTVRRSDPSIPQGRIIAEIEVSSVASASAACTIRSVREGIQIGDEAWMSPEDAEALVKRRTAEEASKFAQVLTFTDSNTLEEEARASVPRPPLPEINRARGRIGFESSTIRNLESSRNSSQYGLVLRIDATRLAGSYWNLSGFYRGRFTRQTSGASEETLTDLIQRTYHLSLNYSNPSSRYVAGFGRLFLPWATSLGTIDGGYVGRHVGKKFTLGLFGGSSPDPTSWRYDRNRQMAGVLVNLEGGSFESFRYSSSFGAALSRIRWRPDRQYGFLETSVLYKRSLSFYYNLETDLLRPTGSNQRKELAASRSYVTVRLQPHRLVSFDINHNYFREIPTFDSRLVATGLVDKLLFHGLSAGVRLELPYRINPYASFGRSNRTGDARNSWNQMYGLAVGNIARTGIRADARYSKFDSSFGRGVYRSIAFTRSVGEGLRFEIQAGRQNFTSPFTLQNRSWWVNTSADWIILRHYFTGGGFTFYRSPGQDYNQWYINIGYVF
jgi:hypothetical protein